MRAVLGFLSRRGLFLLNNVGGKWKPLFTGGFPQVVDADVGVATATTIDQLFPRMRRVALGALDAAGGILAWQNPEAVKILARIDVDFTHASTDACTASFGVAADGATLNAGFLDGVNVGTLGTQPYSSTVWLRVDANGGTNDWITGSKASGAAAGLEGRAYITYMKTSAA